jgi:hypothetical protein
MGVGHGPNTHERELYMLQYLTQKQELEEQQEEEEDPG